MEICRDQFQLKFGWANKNSKKPTDFWGSSESLDIFTRNKVVQFAENLFVDIKKIKITMLSALFFLGVATTSTGPGCVMGTKLCLITHFCGSS